MPDIQSWPLPPAPFNPGGRPTLDELEAQVQTSLAVLVSVQAELTALRYSSKTLSLPLIEEGFHKSGVNSIVAQDWFTAGVRFAESVLNPPGGVK